ncbi:MAG: helix-turn-helix domain-containing protein [Betaproteobacteria bacterium]|nr:helix-turn-helix domain-containing protein [Betaproteobacteria bacterium]
MTDEIRVLPLAGSGLAAESAATDVVAVAMPSSVGEQLRAAREARQMSASGIAQMLKLSVRQVDALEIDDWSTLPGATIVRGFIRNYARLVDLDSDALMAQLDALRTPKSSDLDLLIATNNAALPRTGGMGRRDLAVVFSGLMLAGLALLAYFFVPQEFWQSKLAEWNSVLAPAPPPVLAPEPAPATAAGNVDPLPPAPVSDQPVPSGTPPAADAGVSEKTAPPAVPPAPSVPSVSAVPVVDVKTNQPAPAGSGLKLIFARPSWVEIRDRSGQVVFSQLNPAGSEREIEGQPPFALIVGNASGVTVRYKGKNVELDQRSKDDVARLNLE